MAISAFALCWIALYFVFPYHLVYKEQISLFLSDWSFIAGLASKPGILAVVAGDFLTQFFIYRALAATITVATGVLLWGGFRLIFRKEGFPAPSLTALLPAVAELVLQTQLEYPLSMLAGAVLAVWCAYACISIPHSAVRRTVCAVAVAVSYPLFGAHAILLTIITGIHERKSPVVAVAFVLEYLVSMYIWSRIYLMTFVQSISFPVAEGYTLHAVFLFLAVEACAVLAYLAGMLRLKGWIPAILAFCICSAGFRMMVRPHEEYDLKISTLAYKARWDEVRRLGYENPQKSQTGALYYNISLAREGKLAEGLLDAYQPMQHGLFFTIETSVGYLKYMAGTDSFLECGDYAQAQHAAMIGMTMSPYCKSTRMLRRLSEIAVADGDFAAAGKYLSMLEKTVMHSNWASDLKSLISDGRTAVLNNNRDTVLYANSFQPSLRNILDSGSVSYDSALQYLLCYDLLIKDLESFIKDYNRYYLPFNRGVTPPRLYQESLAMLDAGPQYRVSQQVDDDNQAFLGGNHAAFKKSYWFYFLYARPAEPSKPETFAQ